MNVYQDEPHGVHWDHSQMVIHPIVNYYLDNSGNLVTEEHIMLTDDLRHDKFAVREFECKTLAHLKKKEFTATKIIQFCDNFLGQYKSKGPFQFISEAGIPMIRMFFGVCHGKGPADDAVGRIKSAAKRAVKARQVVIRKAKDFTEFCQSKFHNNNYNPLLKQTFLQEFFYVDNIERDEEIGAVSCPNTRSFYSIRSTGEFCVIEVHKVSCSCESCLYDEGRQCPNQAYASEWKVINIATGKPVLQENFINEHWDPNAKKTLEPSDSNADSNTLPNVPETYVQNVWKRKQSTKNRQPPKQTRSSQKVNWEEIYQEMEETKYIF